MKQEMETVKANQTTTIESKNKIISEKEAALAKKDKELKA